MKNPYNTALKYIHKSYHFYYRHVAIVERGGALVAIGYNIRGGTHAECHALKKLWPSKRKGCKIWSLKVTKSGRFTMAKPCENCEKFIREAGIKTVLYSDESGNIQRLRLR